MHKMKTLAFFVFFFCLLSVVVFAEDASGAPSLSPSASPASQAAQQATNPTGFAFMSEGTMQLGMLALGLLAVGVALDLFVK